jgi:tetratricopeptide (TPR) repeat protein
LVEKEQRRELRNNLGAAIMKRGNALLKLGRLEEAVAAYDETIAIYHELIEKEQRRELRKNLAMAWYNLALTREKQRTFGAALEAAHVARKLWEGLVNEGMKHLEREHGYSKNLETRLALARDESQFGAAFVIIHRHRPPPFTGV